MTAKGYRVSFGDDRNVLRLMVVMVAHAVNILQIAKYIYFKWVNYEICK